MQKPIYFDYNATTPLDPAVFEAMKPYFEAEFGNPSSTSHCYGWEAKMAVDTARKQVAASLNCSPKELIWTSGATESNNTAILGLVRPLLAAGEKVHIISSPTEHKAVLDVCKLCQELGAEVTFVDVDQFGRVSPEDVAKACRPDTQLISIMMANNEIGTLNPISQIGEVAQQKGIIFHTDAAQAVGKIALDVKSLNIDMLSISGVLLQCVQICLQKPS
jgi:cysteine desulfurase